MQYPCIIAIVFTDFTQSSDVCYVCRLEFAGDNFVRTSAPEGEIKDFAWTQKYVLNVMKLR